MGLWTTANQDEFDAVLKDFDCAVRENYGDENCFPFQAGYLRALCVEMLASMPKRKQKEVITSMIRAAERQRAEKLAKAERILV